MKIVRLATAAETLDWDYCFTTTLETAAPVEGGTLAGDLIVRGGDDNAFDDATLVLAFSILATDFTTPAATVNWMTDLAVEKLAEFSRK